MGDMDTGDSRHQRSYDAAQRIEQARKRVVPKMSVRRAALAAGVSEGWWRKVVQGYERHGWDIDPAVASDEALLAMASVVSVRDEVADMLGIEEDQPVLTHDDSDELAELIEQTRQLNARVQRLIDERHGESTRKAQ